MKKYIYSLLAIFVLFAASCRKSDNPRIPDLQRVPVPYIKADATKSPSIDVLNPASFSQTFTFDSYFTSDIPPKQMDLVAIKNGVKTSVKTVQGGFTTFPATANVTGTQLLTLFGPIVLGDNFTFGLDITTQDGSVYHAYPALGVGYGSGVLGEYTGSTNTTPIAAGGGVVYELNFGAICKYSPTLFGALGSTSNFQVLTDEWGDDPVNGWGPPAGYRPTVTVTVVDATHLSFKSPVNGTSTIVLTINPANNNITYTGQPYGDLAVGPLQVDPTWTFGAGTIENVGTNNVAPCDKKLNLAVKYRVSIGTFSNGGVGYKLVLKQP